MPTIQNRSLCEVEQWNIHNFEKLQDENLIDRAKVLLSSKAQSWDRSVAVQWVMGNSLLDVQSSSTNTEHESIHFALAYALCRETLLLSTIHRNMKFKNFVSTFKQRLLLEESLSRVSTTMKFDRFNDEQAVEEIINVITSTDMNRSKIEEQLVAAIVIKEQLNSETSNIELVTLKSHNILTNIKLSAIIKKFDTLPQKRIGGIVELFDDMGNRHIVSVLRLMGGILRLSYYILFDPLFGFIASTSLENILNYMHSHPASFPRFETPHCVGALRTYA